MAEGWTGGWQDRSAHTVSKMEWSLWMRPIYCMSYRSDDNIVSQFCNVWFIIKTQIHMLSFYLVLMIYIAQNCDTIEKASVTFTLYVYATITCILYNSHTLKWHIPW